MQLTLFQLNDVHGYLNLHQKLFYGPTSPEYRRCGGYARIASPERLRRIRWWPS